MRIAIVLALCVLFPSLSQLVPGYDFAWGSLGMGVIILCWVSGKEEGK